MVYSMPGRSQISSIHRSLAEKSPMKHYYEYEETGRNSGRAHYTVKTGNGLLITNTFEIDESGTRIVDGVSFGRDVSQAERLNWNDFTRRIAMEKVAAGMGYRHP